MPSNVLVLKGDILYSRSPENLAEHPDSYLVCENGVVSGIYPQLPEMYSGVPVKDYSGRLVLPGLVDLHLHAPQYPFRSLGMDLELLDWLDTHTFPEESRYGDPNYAAESYRAFVDSLVRSCTTRACVFATVHRPATQQLMALLEASGLRTYVGKVNMDRNCGGALREKSAAQSLEETRAWLAECADFSATKPILTPRFIPSCTDELLAGLGALQRETGLPVQSHLSENPAEVQWVRELCPQANGYGDAYRSFGLFGGADCPTVMAHCVHSDEEEMRLMKRQSVFVAHCPQSNTNLSSGIAPVRRFLELDLPVGLGTDVAGGHSLSLLRAMADTVQVSKLRWRLVDNVLKPLSAAEAFYLGTRGGGAFFGKVGAFEPGWALDAVVLDDSSLYTPRRLTLPQRLERLIYLAEDSFLCAKYVQGKPVL